jgi:hypothetical protein
MLRPRIAQRAVAGLLRRFPAAVILGARQVGKSTLAPQAFPGYAYVDLENPVDDARAEADRALLLSQHDRLVIDEAQRPPALFPALRSFLDARPRRRAVLLGSALTRGWVVNLTTGPVEIRRGVWMCGLRQLLEELRLRDRAPGGRPRTPGGALHEETSRPARRPPPGQAAVGYHRRQPGGLP